MSTQSSEGTQSTASPPFGGPPGLVRSTNTIELRKLDKLNRYRSASRPTRPVTYSFSPVTKHSMVLIPPADAADSRPQYHISFTQNCFCPMSYITSIRRGATERGELVADFEYVRRSP
jgi:hypothetical protein